MPNTSIMLKMNRFVAVQMAKSLELRAGIEYPDHSQDKFLDQIFVRAKSCL